MKRILATLMLVASMFAAKAQTPLTIQLAGASYNNALGNAEFYWYPDQGTDFDTKFYTHTLQSDGSRTYNNYTQKQYGSSSFYFYDAFNTSSTPGSPHRYTHVFVLTRYHYSGIHFETALSDWPDGWPQAYAAANMWNPTTQQWTVAFMGPQEGEYWSLWVVHYNAYEKDMYVEWLDSGSTWNYPTGVGAYVTAHGQW